MSWLSLLLPCTSFQASHTDHCCIRALLVQLRFPGLRQSPRPLREPPRLDVVSRQFRAQSVHRQGRWTGCAQQRRPSWRQGRQQRGGTMAGRGGSLQREPQVELRKLEDDYCEFVLKNTDVSMANALRRVILVEVRSPAWCAFVVSQPPRIPHPSSLIEGCYHAPVVRAPGLPAAPCRARGSAPPCFVASTALLLSRPVGPATSSCTEGLHVAQTVHMNTISQHS